MTSRMLILEDECSIIRDMKNPLAGVLPSSAQPPYVLTWDDPTGRFRISSYDGHVYATNLGASEKLP